MIFIFNEDAYEQSILELFSILGYKHLIGYEIERDYQNPLYMDELENSLFNINKGINKDAIVAAIEKIQNIDIGSLSVNYVENNEERSTLVKLIDFKNIENNAFTVINQWTVEEKEVKRPDIVVFVNGLPLVVCELKSPSREDADTSQAYTQLKKYMQVIPSLFVYNAFCVMSDMALSKAGTITSPEDRFMEWKTTDSSYESTQ